MSKIILSNDTFRSALAVYEVPAGGTATLIGTYRRNSTGDWGAETGDGKTFLAKTKAALRSKIAAHVA